MVGRRSGGVCRGERREEDAVAAMLSASARSKAMEDISMQHINKIVCMSEPPEEQGIGRVLHKAAPSLASSLVKSKRMKKEEGYRLKDDAFFMRIQTDSELSDSLHLMSTIKKQRMEIGKLRNRLAFLRSEEEEMMDDSLQMVSDPHQDEQNLYNLEQRLRQEQERLQEGLQEKLITPFPGTASHVGAEGREQNLDLRPNLEVMRTASVIHPSSLQGNGFDLTPPSNIADNRLSHDKTASTFSQDVKMNMSLQYAAQTATSQESLKNVAQEKMIEMQHWRAQQGSQLSNHHDMSRLNSITSASPLLSKLVQDAERNMFHLTHERLNAIRREVDAMEQDSALLSGGRRLAEEEEELERRIAIRGIVKEATEQSRPSGNVMLADIFRAGGPRLSDSDEEEVLKEEVLKEEEEALWEEEEEGRGEERDRVDEDTRSFLWSSGVREEDPMEFLRDGKLSATSSLFSSPLASSRLEEATTSAFMESGPSKYSFEKDEALVRSQPFTGISFLVTLRTRTNNSRD
ncbi:hypothetical protein GUITHDRAFT_142054 [Guillardia theta CCMP2712]|uniref:Uncharacterized protein n=1 Tax=Guillardia theta (strain CCMP2712) TaxID=905079 RepID=L1IZW0_GUITC|nr:hypothetical protein GUITHDRAFT_142054 [Guillardia theta CCMP2712]EKX41355.1 hypothetical protein GUITHDRAFT_142054 [Guillardia theta CCMP2712]|eukprot:XP_005828335.1 hypothetical protein GUITHDRAFT_142054 [Guillardia theta CCMP2712]